ncbi:MAG TPA: hypothetical protein VHC90_11380 [Bryobacteraceae bacterium]|nr:hypothetical protein [Bryobacteraceae bacterium]
MNNPLLIFCAIGWLVAIPLVLAAWFSPRCLLWLKRRLVARADGLVAASAAYRVAHGAAMEGEEYRMELRRRLPAICADHVEETVSLEGGR